MKIQPVCSSFCRKTIFNFVSNSVDRFSKFEQFKANKMYFFILILVSFVGSTG